MRLVIRFLGSACALTLAAACSSSPPSVMGGGAAGSGGGGAGVSGADGGGVGLPDTLVCKPEARPPSPLSLLTRTQYDATIAELLGDDSQPSKSFPPESQVAGF